MQHVRRKVSYIHGRISCELRWHSVVQCKVGLPIRGCTSSICATKRYPKDGSTTLDELVAVSSFHTPYSVGGIRQRIMALFYWLVTFAIS